MCNLRRQSASDPLFTPFFTPTPWRCSHDLRPPYPSSARRFCGLFTWAGKVKSPQNLECITICSFAFLSKNLTDGSIESEQKTAFYRCASSIAIDDTRDSIDSGQRQDGSFAYVRFTHRQNQKRRRRFAASDKTTTTPQSSRQRFRPPHVSDVWSFLILVALFGLHAESFLRRKRERTTSRVSLSNDISKGTRSRTPGRGSHNTPLATP